MRWYRTANHRSLSYTGVIFVGHIIGSLLVGLVLAFAIGLGVIASIDGLTGCDSTYTYAQRDRRMNGIVILGLLTLLTGHITLALGFVLGAIMAMRALQGLYKEMSSTSRTAVRRTA